MSRYQDEEESPLLKRYREEIERRDRGTQQVTGICPACGDLLIGAKHSRITNSCPGVVRVRR